MNNILKKLMTITIITVMLFTLAIGCSTQKEELNDEEVSTPAEQSSISYPMEIIDGYGNKVTLDKQPTKIISLAPSHTEILFALGLDDEIIGVTPYCVYPEKATTKENVGDAFNINIEKILELEPDLFIQYGPGKEDVNNKLSSSGIVVLSYAPESIEEVINLINEIGRATNKIAEAEAVTQDMISKKDYILETVKEANKPKVFFEVWDEPLQTAGPGSFLDELINLAGGDNIAKDAQGAYAQFDLEQLIERNPDIYITSKDVETKTVESIKARAGFDEINAIKNDRIYILDPLISIPGPRIIDGLEMLAKSIHPELFD